MEDNQDAAHPGRPTPEGWHMRNYWAGTVLVAGGMVAWGAYRGCSPPGAAGGRPDEGGALGPEDGDALPGTRAPLARIAAKERAVHSLLAGDCTLLGAAARFRELDAREPAVLPGKHPEVYAGDTEAERYCRAVLFWADNAARGRTPEAEADRALAAVRRLEEELGGLRLRGTLEMPPPTGPGRHPGGPSP